MIYAIQTGGLRRLCPTGIYLVPQLLCYLGASSSPDRVVLESVTEKTITYYAPPYRKTSRIERCFGEDLIAQGTRTMVEQTQRSPCYERDSWKQYVDSLEAVLRGEPGILADVTDYQYVEVEIRSLGDCSDPFRTFERKYGRSLYGSSGSLLQGSMCRASLRELQERLDIECDFEVVSVKECEA